MNEKFRYLQLKTDFLYAIASKYSKQPSYEADVAATIDGLVTCYYEISRWLNSVVIENLSTANEQMKYLANCNSRYAELEAILDCIRKVAGIIPTLDKAKEAWEIIS